MKKGKRIMDLAAESNIIEQAEAALDFDRELLPLLELLEEINPCGQEYEIDDNWFLVSYFLKLNLFNFIEGIPFKLKVQIIGLPLSVSEKGYWGEEALIESQIKKRKGLKIVLNGDPGFENAGKTLSTFIFINKFDSFKEYLDSLRSPYRRRLNKALEKRKDILINKLDRIDFREAHYNLYRSVMNRTKNPLEILPMEFFREYEAELYEFRDKKTDGIIGFIQLKERRGRLCFLFGGFEKENNETHDIYFNMLLKIIETGIEKKVQTIEFGQTAEESKLKIGCMEVPKYLAIHHSNPLLNGIIQAVLTRFSYKPYQTRHHVFKDNL